MAKTSDSFLIVPRSRSQHFCGWSLRTMFLFMMKHTILFPILIPTLKLSFVGAFSMFGDAFEEVPENTAVNVFGRQLSIFMIDSIDKHRGCSKKGANVNSSFGKSGKSSRTDSNL